MKSYKLITLTHWDGFQIKSTDSSIFDWVASETRRLIPDCRVSRQDTFTLVLNNLHGKDYELQWQFMKWLCERGWEPFAVHASGQYASQMEYHLRYEVVEG